MANLPLTARKASAVEAGATINVESLTELRRLQAVARRAPAELRARMLAWLDRNAQSERKPNDTDCFNEFTMSRP